MTHLPAELEFKKSDANTAFEIDDDVCITIGEANALLSQRLGEVREVFGAEAMDGTVWDWSDDKCQEGSDTHRALLVCITKLGDEG